MMPGFSLLYCILITSCLLHVCKSVNPRMHTFTHREGGDNLKSGETNSFKQGVLKLENN